MEAICSLHRHAVAEGVDALTRPSRVRSPRSAARTTTRSPTTSRRSRPTGRPDLAGNGCVTRRSAPQLSSVGGPHRLGYDIWGAAKDLILYIRPRRSAAEGGGVIRLRAATSSACERVLRDVPVAVRAVPGAGRFPMNGPSRSAPPGSTRPRDVLVAGAGVPRCRPRARARPPGVGHRLWATCSPSRAPPLYALLRRAWRPGSWRTTAVLRLRPRRVVEGLGVHRRRPLHRSHDHPQSPALAVP